VTSHPDPNDDDLDPRVLAAFIEVPPIDEAIREAHIAAALAYAPTLSRARPAWLSIAAACIALLLTGGFVGRFTTSSPTVQANGPSPRVSAVKNVAIESTTCRSTVTGARFLGTYSITDAVRLIYIDSLNVQIWDEETCKVVSTIPHAPPAQP